MPLSKTIKRELEVAFSKDAQPLWLRILKYLVLVVLIYFYWESKSFWILLLAIFIGSIALHLWARYKTKGWTKSYGLWKHESERNLKGK